MKRLYAGIMALLLAMAMIGSVHAEGYASENEAIESGDIAVDAFDSETVDIDEKTYCQVTLENDFAEDIVLVTLTHACTVEGITFTPAHFPMIEAASVVSLTDPVDRYFAGGFEELEEEVQASILELANLEEFHQILKITLQHPGKAAVLQAVKQLEQLDFVQHADPDCYIPIDDCEPVDTTEDQMMPLSYEEQNRLEGQASFVKIQTEQAWDLARGERVSVGVIDSGISNHPDLSTALQTGWDFVNNNSITTDDPIGHGTHVAGIIEGLDWRVDLIPLQVVERYVTAENKVVWQFLNSAILDAITYATERNIPIVNCSFEYYASSASYQQSMRNYQGLIVCAAGNGRVNTTLNRKIGVNIDNDPCLPAGFAYDNILSVTATTNTDALAEFSNYGSVGVDLAAPGTNIYSTISATQYDVLSGTSMAAPHVTGVAALIKSTFPELTTAQIKKAIMESVDKVAALNGKCVTGGRLNANMAMHKARYANQANWAVDQTACGDFNGDGKEDVVTIISTKAYNDDTNQIEMLVSLGGSSQTIPWKIETKYTGSKIVGRVTAGDFNGDGYDDVAMMYDYGDNLPKIHVFLSTGSSFSNWTTWLTQGGYFNPSRIVGRFTAGDFNGDGKDDIAVMYDYEDHTAKILVCTSKGNGFNYWTTWYAQNTPNYYNVPRVAGRFKAGDFNGDGKDDIATMYGYADGTTKIHVFPSAGNKFTGCSFWYTESRANYYSVGRVDDRFTVGDFNNDGKADVATMYDYENGTMEIHVFLSTGTALGNWQRWKLQRETGTYYVERTSAFVAGDFNGDGKDDVTARYDYAVGIPSLLCFQSTGNNFAAAQKWIADIWF